MKQQYKVDIILSGGGTGGHVFPAIAVAQELLALRSGLEILFVGAMGKMEMEKVPLAGFKIIGLPVSAFHRRLSWKNLLFPFKLLISMMKARRILKFYQPDLVIGTGGFASGPLLKAAHQRGISTMIQEQNAYPGVTNRLLAKQSARICVAHENMETWFPAHKLVVTGNPVRSDLITIADKHDEAMKAFNLKGDRLVVLLFGGSLGALALNEAISSALHDIETMGVDLIWQTGKSYYQKAVNLIESQNCSNVQAHVFLQRMDLAYAAADVVVCRAGAITLSELSLVKKPALLVPYPAAAGNHQLKNARSFEQQGAAVVLENKFVKTELIKTLKDLLDNEMRRSALSAAITALGRPGAGKQIARVALELLDKRNDGA
ncbi:MAG: undecaprenyldiphospho-muramoylpentapeptide beta-N-acetylglucosaminyltransferase [Bacteroidales bacterium]|nr:undecaprenyldiphospho-muramoylpentapeptide beta-N-acetylglucosaminyltransferase [Bacteroidales bacterium]